MKFAPALLLLMAACTKSNYVVKQPPASGMLEKYTEIFVMKVATTVWLESKPRVRENPAYAQWRSEIGVASDQIPATAKKFLSEYYEIKNEAGPGTISVKLELMDFNPGSGDALGEGNGIVKVKVTLIDPSGKEFGSSEVESQVKMGSVRKAYDQVGRSLAMFIIQSRPEKKKEDE